MMREAFRTSVLEVAPDRPSRTRAYASTLSQRLDLAARRSLARSIAHGHHGPSSAWERVDRGLYVQRDQVEYRSFLSFISAVCSPLCAMCGRLPGWQVKTSLCVASRCSHVLGLLARFSGMTAGHNALRGSGPGQKPALKSTVAHGVVLIARSTGSALRAVRPPNLHITPDVQRDLVHAASATGSL